MRAILLSKTPSIINLFRVDPYLKNITMKLLLIISFIPIIFGTSYSCDNKITEKHYGVINLSVANIRSKPDNAAELSTQALLGMPVVINKKSVPNDEKTTGWFYVQTPDKYQGWLDEGGFQIMDEKEFKDWSLSPKIIYTGYFGFSYSEENNKSIPVSDMVAGDVLKLIDEKNNFFKVEYPDKRIAYIPKNAASYYDEWINSREANAENILKTAKSLMGIPYLWGGTSVKGVDCSGFTKTVYFLNGVQLLRDASQQAETGELIDTKNGFLNLQPGDLVFFGKKGSDGVKEKITHVGIYIGNLEYIHASGRVKISSFDKSKENFSEGRLKAFVKAKRIMTSINKNGIYSLKSLQ